MLLFIASKDGHAEAVSFLLSLRADPNYQNEVSYSARFIICT